ncbi:MAG: EAL domain-containing protein [Gallionellaceae bacterium]
MSNLPKILVVDDITNNRIALRQILKGIGVDVHEAANGFDALTMCLAEEYALILLDVQMPEMDGFEVCEQLRADPRTANTPIIFLTAAFKDETDKMRGYVAGATDYLAKPIEDHILKAKAEVFLRLYKQQRLLQEKNESLRIAASVFESQEGMMITDANNVILRVNSAFIKITGYSSLEVVGKTPCFLKSGRHDANFYASMWASLVEQGAWEGEVWNRRKSGEVYPERLTISAVKDENNAITNYVASFSDITQSKAAADEIEHLAFYDPLTQLPNRRLLRDRLRQSLASNSRSGYGGALLFIDLDDFKALNDTLGHDKGDLLLQQVAERLLSCVREGDTVARMGGDEFVVMLEDLSHLALDAASQAEAIGGKILKSLNQPYTLSLHEHRSTPSIGVTLFDNKQSELDELLKQADIAMYQAKKEGRNTMRFFDQAMQDAVMVRATMEADLRSAILGKEQFRLYYQMQIDSTGCVLGAEALARWMHPLRGMISPAEFIPLAEDTGLILPLGHWVLSTACQQLADWAAQPATASLCLAVNVSGKQILTPTFVDEVLALVEFFKIGPARLKLEITESMLLGNVDDIIDKMNVLKAHGIDFSMDDFGTGYSSLQYLKRLPINQLKIDQSFVRDIATDNSDKAIIRTIIAMAIALDLDIIAEGVELEEQRKLLLEQGCMRFQGFLFGKPVPIAEFEAQLELNVTVLSLNKSN